ncbi:MAG: thiamine phosphate synthase [Verrucomicrobiota bacterium]|nr:thiamine phosphate synthase [Verrucomicrobiota bacterium]
MTLKDCRLYGILDLAYVARADAERVVQKMIEGGVDILQLRAKHENVTEIAEIARALQAITSAAHIPFVINDYAHVARDVGADGVHVGQDDISVAEVRKLLGPYGFVGKSTHSLEQAIAAQTEGADYIGFGPLFATPTKPDYAPIGLNQIGAAHAAVKLPIFCIGGIKLSNLAHVIAAGARRVVIVSGLLQARDIAEYARSAQMLLTRGTQR